MFAELEQNLKALNTQIEPNPYHQRTQTEHEPKIVGSFSSLVVTFQTRVQFLLSKMQGMESSQNFCHVAQNVPLNTLSQNSVHML